MTTNNNELRKMVLEFVSMLTSEENTYYYNQLENYAMEHSVGMPYEQCLDLLYSF